jgi:HK97 family phage portal protein
MGIFDIFKRRETRAIDPSWDAIGRVQGGAVTPTQAENLASVLACVQVISSSIASLPAWVYQVGESGRKPIDHPVKKMIDAGPNRDMTWPDFIEFLLSQALLWGNSIAWIKTDTTGTVTEIQPIPWQNVTYELMKSGRVRFTCTMPHTLETVRLLDDDVLWIKDRSDDGIIGRSRLSRAGSAIRTSLYLQDFSESLYENGVNPSGALCHDGKLSIDNVQQLRERFEAAHRGSGKAGKVLILDNGLKWESIQISPEDAELLDSRKFSAIEIFRLYQVPPPLAGDFSHSSFTNSETASRWFAQFCLTPWVRKVESEFKRGIFTGPDADKTIEIDLSGFMRGDYETRWKAHKIAVDAGILDTDEIREIEGWGPKARS